jgi:hypothetical protein
MPFTLLREDESMTNGRRRYGAIVWHPGAEIDDAIRLVKAADDPEEAVGRVASLCPEDQRWAVVDLATMNVVASGPASRD